MSLLNESKFISSQEMNIQLRVAKRKSPDNPRLA